MNARASEAITENETAVASLQQLGNALRQAREARGISLEEVAARLRLAARVVRDIEAGAFEHLPAATYARGYLRAYANFVGIKSDSLLAAYDQYADKPPEINPYASTPQPQVQATDLPMRAVTYAIVAIILGSVGVWLWQTQKLSALDSLSIPKWGAESASTTPVAIEAPHPSSTTRTENVAVPNTSSATTPNAATASAQSSNVAEVSAGSVASPTPTAVVQLASTPANNEASAPSSVQTASSGVTPPTSSSTASAANVVDAAIAASGMRAVPAQGEIPYSTSPATNSSGTTTTDATLPPGEHVLTFDCAEDSWLEVYDSENTRLYYNIAKQGSRVSVQGLLPYHVKVGNAPAVQVNYEGHPLDMTAFSQGSVARFQLTPDGYLAQP
ncbi:MAG: DUF4115 domain-containing protein [Gammaproteobacteria bacterium]